MALDIKLQTQISEITDGYWSKHSKDAAFTELIRGKEPGHRMADYVDDKTTSLLKVNFDTRYEGDPSGNIKKRSMGDVWVHSQRIFNPINVKAGLQGMNGQPNLVSMRKLLDYIFKRLIDSYYLLIIKFDNTNDIQHKAYLVDLLDWIDFVTYNAGPGQIMLREKEFYDAYESGHTPPQRTILEKAELLFSLFEQKLKALYDSRQKTLHQKQSELNTFMCEPFVVDQSKMVFVP